MRAKLGTICFWLTWPLIFAYSFISRPRARVIIVYKDQVLLVKNWLGPGTWALPGGGLERSEPPIAAACREVQEELGIVLDVQQLQDLGRHTFRGRGGMPVKCYLFATSLSKEPQLTLQTHEIMAAEWQPIDHLMTYTDGVGRGVTDSLAAWSADQNLV